MKWWRRRKNRSVANRWPTWCGEPKRRRAKRSAVPRCGVLHEAAIKPWQYEHWIFPRDPRFAEKAGPILDLYAGKWEGKQLGPKDYVLCMDEKTSIQARQRCHEETPPKSKGKQKRKRRIEPEYKRKGALQYLAAWDVHRGIVLGRCEAKTGIKPFGRLVDQVLEQEPYHDAERLFFVVDNSSSHRGQTSVERMRRRDKKIILVHTPVHASWLNQVEIYWHRSKTGQIRFLELDTWQRFARFLLIRRGGGPSEWEQNTNSLSRRPPMCFIPFALWISNAAARFSGIRGAVSIQARRDG